MMKAKRIAAMAAVIALVFPILSALPARAQERMSDKDVEQRIKNMDEDIKKFRSMFSSAIGKTSLRKTTQEKDDKKLVQDFQGQSKSLYDKFKSTKKADPYLQTLLSMQPQIEGIFHSAQFDSATVAQWEKIKPQLKVLAVQFNVPGY